MFDETRIPLAPPLDDIERLPEVAVREFTGAQLHSGHSAWRGFNRAIIDLPRPVRVGDLLLLCVLTLAALLVHGYHPFVEDAEIYLPGVLKLVQPSLFPQNNEFFQSHASMTWFPNIIAASIRWAHLPVPWALLVWQCVSVFALLYACWRIARLVFRSQSGTWCAVALVASLLTIPVAGTALYLMDQYLTPRSFSTPGAMLAIAAVLERRYIRAGAWIVLTAIVHPLMSVFVLVYVAILVALRLRSEVSLPAFAVALPALFPAITPAYRDALNSRPYFLLANWAWYEWIGLLAPFVVLACFIRIARERDFGPMILAARALIVFEAAFCVLALAISTPGRFERFSEIQPLRCLHLVYCLMFVLGGGLIGEFLLGGRALRWAVLFVPLCVGMWFAQRQMFPATTHLEWPWLVSSNPWVEAFDWIENHTPEDAYFALDPKHAQMASADEHGFRALARRSMIADGGKDGGAVSMFPALAERWREQTAATQGWGSFQLADFERLKHAQGVGWVVVKTPGVTGLLCPYSNSLVSVCRIQ